MSRLLFKEERKRKRLAELGLDYEFTGYRGLCETSATAKTPSHIIFTDEEEEEEEEGGESGKEAMEGTESE